MCYSGYDKTNVNCIGRVVELLLMVVISPSWNVRDRMVVSGVVIIAPLLVVVGIFPFSNGRERTGAIGIEILLRNPLHVGISPSSSGVPGIRRLAPLQLVVVISLFSDGRERIDRIQNGTKTFLDFVSKNVRMGISLWWMERSWTMSRLEGQLLFASSGRARTPTLVVGCQTSRKLPVKKYFMRK